MDADVFSHWESTPQAWVDGGPLHARRAAIQCSICVKGWPAQAGSLALTGFVPPEDATVVQRLKLAGAALVGSTHASELGFGLVRDGAARAIRDGHADVAIMVDTMGEARVAAASAGLFGFKPSYGRISRFGLVGLVPSMDCCSILGNNLEDIGSVFKAIEGPDERDPSMADCRLSTSQWTCGRGNSPISAGIVTQCLEVLDDNERGVFMEALGRLRDAGIEVREVQCEDFDLFRTTHNVIGSVEASSSCGKFDGVRYGHCAAGARNWNEMYLRSRGESFGLLLKSYLFQGAYFQFENYPAFEQACRIRARLAEGSRRLLCGAEVLISPTRREAMDPGLADTVDRVYDTFALTLPANVTGQPALSLPGFLSTRHGDLGLQMVGPPVGDDLLLEVAGRLCPRTEQTR